MRPRVFVRLPVDPDANESNWVDPDDILAVVENRGGSDIWIRGLDRPVFTTLTGRELFDRIVDDYIKVTSS